MASLLMKQKFGTAFSIGILYTLLFAVSAYTQDELNVISKWLYFKDPSFTLYNHFSEQAYAQLNQRNETIEKVNTLEGWKQRQQEVRETLLDIVGPFPEKTPLNAQVVRIVKKEGFRAEHIIYESRPGFKVTSTLFIPEGLKRNEKGPAIIYCSGHGPIAYRSQGYQHMILNLVKKGFIVFAFDPVGQGERLEYYNSETGKSDMGSPTREHSYPGAQTLIAGSSQANYMIWDGIRAVDYLLTRKEVDGSRIGITGRSGGGTQSIQIAAFDDRILAAAPENYLTNYTRLLQSRGPQDAEQNFYHGIYRGIDHPDLLEVRAPKPALMVLTYNDMFNIQGARDTYREAARIYEAYGKRQNMEVTEDFGGHTSTKKNREAIYAFFQKHLGHPGNPRDEEITPLSREEIRITPTGQLSTSLGSETVFSLNYKQSEENHTKLQRARRPVPNWHSQIVTQAKILSGYLKPENLPDPVLTGIVKKEEFIIEKYFLMGEGDYPLPYLLYVPERLNNKGVLYLHPQGKKTDSLSLLQIDALVKEGFIVLTPDLPGTGETFPLNFQGDAHFGEVSYNLWFASFLVGRTILGVRAGDVERLTTVMQKDTRIHEVHAIAKGNMSPVLLHSAVFSPVFKRIALIEPISSYRAVVMEKYYSPAYIHNAVPGVLCHYDLPDLAGSLAPVKLLITDAVDGTGKISDSPIIREDLSIIRNGYTAKGAVDSLVILNGATSEKLAIFFR
ncbi:alpha/beta hydrolase family protein [Proteiniphilum sp.]|uniref:alpha/beta hydrolase n=1 Tax=Proteiniphilum sp. TaxID=1926877 RepID=UPI003319E895